MDHTNLTAGKIHTPCQWEYADDSERTGASGFTSSDVGKFARQLDNNFVYMLLSTTPTWQLVSVDTGRLIPAGGTAGQILVKQSATDYDVAWETP